MLLKLLCFIWILREIARHEDPAGNRREPGGANDAGQGQGFDGSFGGRDAADYLAFLEMQRRLAAAEAAMVKMRHQLAAERRQRQDYVDMVYSVVYGEAGASRR